MLSMHKHVHSKATYILRVHQFTTQQVGKGDKGRNKFSLNTKWVRTNMFIERQLTGWECTSSQHSKWVKEVKEGTNFHSTPNPTLTMHKHVHSKATYPLRVYQFTTQQVTEAKEGMNSHSSHNIQSWVCTNMFIERQLTDWEYTSSHHRKWEKRSLLLNYYLSHKIQSWVYTHETPPLSTKLWLSFSILSTYSPDHTPPSPSRTLVGRGLLLEYWLWWGGKPHGNLAVAK